MIEVVADGGNRVLPDKGSEKIRHLYICATRCGSKHAPGTYLKLCRLTKHRFFGSAARSTLRETLFGIGEGDVESVQIYLLTALYTRNPVLLFQHGPFCSGHKWKVSCGSAMSVELTLIS